MDVGVRSAHPNLRATITSAFHGEDSIEYEDSVPYEDTDDNNKCGPDDRAMAFKKALMWAGAGGLGTDINNWEPIQWNQYIGKGGQNYTLIRQLGEQYFGYWNPKVPKARILNHPDGHPSQIGPGYPPHHSCPHYHSVNRSGVEYVFIYKWGT